jgi:hypothetical protein
MARFSRGPVLSAPATAAYYAARNHITASPIVSAVASRTRTEECDGFANPLQSVHEAAAWFDYAVINDNTREKIGRTNAERLLGLKG